MKFGGKEYLGGAVIRLHRVYLNEGAVVREMYDLVVQQTNEPIADSPKRLGAPNIKLFGSNIRVFNADEDRVVYSGCIEQLLVPEKEPDAVEYWTRNAFQADLVAIALRIGINVGHAMDQQEASRRMQEIARML